MAQIKIKNQCASCRGEFQNPERHHAQFGNYCNDCNAKIENMAKWRRLKHRGKLSAKDRRKLSGVGRAILKRWGIDMIENDLSFQGFRKNLKGIFNLTD